MKSAFLIKKNSWKNRTSPVGKIAEKVCRSVFLSK